MGLFNLKFQAMGTSCGVIFRSADLSAAKAYRSEVLSWIKRFEQRYSRFQATSLISQINRAAGDGMWVELDEDANDVLGMIDSVHFLSKGVLDPTALPLTRMWKRAADAGMEPEAGEVETALALVGWPKVEREDGRIRLPIEGMALDLGGYGKEYAVDHVASLAESFGIGDVLVDFGRDLRALGTPGDAPFWVIGVEDAAHPGNVWERLGLSDRGVASSGNYRRSVKIGERAYGHLIDCRSGWPVWHDCQGVSVIADSCFKAGILASSAFILGPHEGKRLIEDAYGCEGVLQTETRKLETPGYHAYLVDDSPNQPYQT